MKRISSFIFLFMVSILNGYNTAEAQNSVDIPNEAEVSNLLEENRNYLGLEEPPGMWRRVTVLNPNPIKRIYQGKVDTLQHGDTCQAGRHRSDHGRHYEASYPNTGFLHWKGKLPGGKILKEIVGADQEVQYPEQCPKGVLISEY